MVAEQVYFTGAQKVVIEKVYSQYFEKVSGLVEQGQTENNDAVKERIAVLRRERDSLLKELLKEEHFARFKRQIAIDGI